jgi:hypothetical protein
MIDENNPVVDETIIETPEAGTEDAGQPTPEEAFDYEKSDNVAKIREYAKGLKGDLDTYKATHTAVEEKFGDVRNLDVAQSVYSGFAGTEFDPDNFAKTLEQLSPARAKQLFEKVAAAKTPELVQAEVEKVFGGKVTPEEIRLFKQFKDSGFGLGEGTDIPEALKLNPDGTPKSDEEIAFLRELQRTVQETKNTLTENKTSEEAEAKRVAEETVQANIGKFSNDRVKILDKEFEGLGLDPSATDTTDARQEKEIIRQVLINGVSGLFLADVEASKDYNAAIEHIANGEMLLARGYESRIEKKLVEIMRSKPIQRLVSSLTIPEEEKEVRPEISNSGASTGDTPAQTGRVSADDIFASLVKEGKVKP